MTQPRPMSTPIFDELLREYASRMEDQRTATPGQPSPAEQPEPATPGQTATRHRAE
ncbi:hypothetical protein KIPE111705_30135 [Kibdelosporangium persicum]|uniref:hypothetical protein n=1 Tax=Kibdelosporangium persicum TaxID=2698649 RepID=UPI0015630A29|nr:hypothetical protein [Kibdelosporangium persicum]